MSIAAAVTLSWAAKACRRKVRDIGDGLGLVSLEGGEGFAAPLGSACTDELIADVSLQNSKASKIPKISLCLFWVVVEK